MPSLAELFEDAVGPLPDAPAFREVERRAHRRRVRRRVATATAVVLALVAAVVAWPRTDDRRVVHTVGRGVFPTRTGVVLVASDGYDGAVFVDLDRRIAVRQPLEGERAGDQPFRLEHVDDSFVVGWGEVVAVPLHGGKGTVLSTDAVYYAAAEPGTVWLTDYNRWTHAWQVDLRGRVLHDVALDGHSYPVRGVLGGLAVQGNDASVTIVDATTGARRPLGPSAWITDVRGPDVLWNQGGTTVLHLTNAESSADRTFEVGPVQSGGATLSPDGHTIAVHASGAIRLVDVATGVQRPLLATEDAATFAWSPDSRQLFFGSGSYQQESTTLHRYDARTDEVTTVDLPFGGLVSIGLQTLTPADARVVFRSRLGPASACQPPTVMPSTRTGPCGFRF